MDNSQDSESEEVTSNISEVIPSDDALRRIYCKMMGTPHEKLADLRIIAVYKTSSGDYMIPLFVMGGWHIMFLSQYRDTLETFSLSSWDTESSAERQAKEIARMIGAVLLSGK